MTQENKNDNIEIVEKSEYADMIVDYIQLNGTVFRKPKEWYPELVYNSKKHQPAKISTQIPNVSMNMSPTSGLMIELKFPLSKENAEVYRSAINSGKKFKIYVPNNRMIKIIFDNNLKEAIRANNRHVGFEQYKIMEGYGELVALDIDDGSLILKVVVRS
jgi:hypothetical protein